MPLLSLARVKVPVFTSPLPLAPPGPLILLAQPLPAAGPSPL